VDESVTSESYEAKQRALGEEVCAAVGGGLYVEGVYGVQMRLLYPGGDKCSGPGYCINSQDVKKWSVSVIWPMSKDRSHFNPPNDANPCPAINVSKHQGGHQLGRDIARRMWEPYRHEWEARKKQADEYDTAQQNQRFALVNLLGVIGCEPRPDNQSTAHGYGNPYVGKITVNHNGTEASIELQYMPFDFARKVLEFVKKNTSEE